MVEASSWWQQFINQIPGWSLPKFKTRATLLESSDSLGQSARHLGRKPPLRLSAKQRIIQRFQEPGGALLLLTIIVAMLLWDWKLLLATSGGIGMMLLVYSI